VLSLSRGLLAAAVLAAAGAVLLFLTQPAEAHERRQVGDIWMVVGFRNEPALVNQPNALDLRVYRLRAGADPQNQTAADRIGITGLEETLKAEIIRGSDAQKMDLPLHPRFNDPGAYDGRVIPTAAGSYTFRVFGTVEGRQIDERFTSGPQTFGDVEETADLQFPVKVLSNQELESRLDDGGGGDSTATAALAVSIVALVLGGAGAALGIVSMRRRTA
jgi:hypothetical protein